MYKVVGTHYEEWSGLYERAEGKAFASIFPFEIRMKDDSSAFIRFFFRPSPGYRWIIVNLVALIIAIILIRRRGWAIGANIADLLIVGLTGIYGLAATQFFPNKFTVNKQPNNK